MVTSSQQISQTLENFLREAAEASLFSIREKQTKAFMFASMVKALLTSDQNIGTTSIPRTRGINQSRILSPTVYESVPCRNDFRSTVLNNVRKSDELDTTVDGPTTNENDTAYCEM